MNIITIFKKFPTQKTCIEFIEQARWGSIPTCPYCQSTHTKKDKEGFRHYCYTCKTSFSVTVQTIFHHTHMPLQKWFLAISLILNAKKGISALQLSRDIEVNKNTAWRIAMQIRKSMNQAGHNNLLAGIVEMDETYVGGKPRRGGGGDKPKRGRGTKKTPVIGAVERGGRVKAKVVKKDKMKGKNLRAFVKETVDISNSHLMTDEYKGYLRMSKIVPHSVIKHQKWYVEGNIHTNTIESFWALLKRGMFGQFHSVSKKHLQKYVDEFCYRYNLREVEKADAFDMTLNLALGV